MRLSHRSVAVNSAYHSFVCHLTPTVAGGFAIAMGGDGAHRGRLFARADGGGIRFGIAKGDSVPEIEAPFVVAPGPHFVVLRWTHGASDALALFVDPDPTGPEPTPDAVATGGTNADSISELRIRQDANAPSGTLDEVRLGVTWAQVTAPDLAVHGMFSDHMVLQRHQSVPVWGTARDGDSVSVTIAGQSVATTAINGRWRVDLAPMIAGGPHTMTVQGPTHAVQFDDVMVGEFWVLSGQSNMRFDLADATTGPAVVAVSAIANLRLCEVTSADADDPLEDVGARWLTSDPTTSATFSAVGWFFGAALEQNLAVPIGLIEATVGGTSIKTWLPNAIAAGYPEVIAQKLTATNSGRPTARYNGMVAPIQPFAIRGVAWYQGEADASRTERYASWFPAMIGGWRNDWGQGDFPFLFVQLAAYGGAGGSRWPLLREAQRATLGVPGTAMVVTMDVGESTDIHPPAKRPVGERLALAARARVYGQHLEFSGPTPLRVIVTDSIATVTFGHAFGGLVVQGGGAPVGFEIAGSDRVFHPAAATVVGDTVRLASPSVSDPHWVRYGWAGFPQPALNLVNVDGLRAAPFMTPRSIPGFVQRPGTHKTAR